MSSKKVYLIRHGQTDFNIQGIVQGSGVDTHLNEKGKKQAQLFYDMYKEVPFNKIYTSTLIRSIQTVNPFVERGIPHETHSGLNEINWGSREGTRITPEEDAYYHALLKSWEDGETGKRIEGGESPQDVAERQKEFLEMMLNRPDEENILVCMHGRAMRILLCQLLNYPLHCMDMFEHQNVCLYLLAHTGSMFTVQKYKDIEHLREL